MWKTHWPRFLVLEIGQWLGFYWLQPWRIKEMWRALTIIAEHGGRWDIDSSVIPTDLINLMFRRRLLNTEHIGMGFYSVILTQRACWMLQYFSRGSIFLYTPGHQLKK